MRFDVIRFCKGRVPNAKTVFFFFFSLSAKDISHIFESRVCYK